jgi:hypothetical protein
MKCTGKFGLELSSRQNARGNGAERIVYINGRQLASMSVFITRASGSDNPWLPLLGNRISERSGELNTFHGSSNFRIRDSLRGCQQLTYTEHHEYCGLRYSTVALPLSQPARVLGTTAVHLCLWNWSGRGLSKMQCYFKKITKNCEDDICPRLEAGTLCSRLELHGEPFHLTMETDTAAETVFLGYQITKSWVACIMSKLTLEDNFVFSLCLLHIMSMLIVVELATSGSRHEMSLA